MTRASLCAWTLALAGSVLGAAGSAHAEPANVPAGADSTAPSRVIVEHEGAPSDALSDVTMRVTAELHVAGFQVLDWAESQAAASTEPIAWIMVLEGERADVWVRDPIRGGLMVQRVDARDVDPASARSALALRAVEILRATFLDLAKDPSERRALPADVVRFSGAPEIEPLPAAYSAPWPLASAPAEARAAAGHDAPIDAARPAGPDAKGAGNDRPMRTWIGAGLGSLISYAVLGLSFGPRIAVVRDLPVSFGVGGSVLATFAAHQVAVDAQQLLALGHLFYTFGAPTWVVKPRLDFALGVHGYRSNRDVAAAPLLQPGGQLGLGFAASPGFAVDFAIGSRVLISVDAAALFVLPEPVLFTGEGSKDSAGYPMIRSSLGVAFAP